MADLLAQLQSQLTDASASPLSEAQLNHLCALLGPNVLADPASIISSTSILVISGNPPIVFFLSSISQIVSALSRPQSGRDGSEDSFQPFLRSVSPVLPIVPPVPNPASDEFYHLFLFWYSFIDTFSSINNFFRHSCPSAGPFYVSQIKTVPSAYCHVGSFPA